MLDVCGLQPELQPACLGVARVLGLLIGCCWCHLKVRSDSPSAGSGMVGPRAGRACSIDCYYK
jgi:hypothetical protein